MEYAVTNNNQVKVSHKGDILLWEFKGFSKSALANGEGGLEYVNKYLRSLPEIATDKMFTTLKGVHVALMSVVGSIENRRKIIHSKVVEFINTIRYDDLEEWVAHSDIPRATNCKSQYDPTDKDPAKTYLKQDYPDLLVLVMVLKLMSGIWGEYIEQMRSEVGTHFKEYSAYRLLEGTWVEDSPGMIRLEAYVCSWIAHQNKTKETVIGGISSLELPVIVMAHVLVRKLGPGPIADKIDSGGLISAIHSGVTTFLRDMKSKFTLLKDKVDSAGDHEEGNSSKVEMYMITQVQSAGNIMIHKHFVNRTFELAKKVDSTLPPELLKECLDTITNLYSYIIEPHVLLLTQWTLAKCVPARIFYNLTREEMLRLIALAQALMWHWEFHDLALVLTANVDRNRLVQAQFVSNTKRRVKADPMEYLDELYLYRKTTKSRPRDANLAHQAISQFKEELGSVWLKYNPTPSMEEYSKSQTHNNNCSLVPDDLTTQLAEMLVKVGN